MTIEAKGENKGENFQVAVWNNEYEISYNSDGGITHYVVLQDYAPYSGHGAIVIGSYNIETTLEEPRKEREIKINEGQIISGQDLDIPAIEKVVYSRKKPKGVPEGFTSSVQLHTNDNYYKTSRHHSYFIR
mgnify:CR=1 FL=1